MRCVILPPRHPPVNREAGAGVPILRCFRVSGKAGLRAEPFSDLRLYSSSVANGTGKTEGQKSECRRWSREEGLRTRLVSSLNKGNSEDMAPPESLRNQGIRGEERLIPVPFSSVPRVCVPRVCSSVPGVCDRVGNLNIGAIPGIRRMYSETLLHPVPFRSAPRLFCLSAHRPRREVRQVRGSGKSEREAPWAAERFRSLADTRPPAAEMEVDVRDYTVRRRRPKPRKPRAATNEPAASDGSGAPRLLPALVMLTAKTTSL